MRNCHCTSLHHVHRRTRASSIAISDLALPPTRPCRFILLTAMIARQASSLLASGMARRTFASSAVASKKVRTLLPCVSSSTARSLCFPSRSLFSVLEVSSRLERCQTIQLKRGQGGIGQPLSLLLKTVKDVSELTLFDIKVRRGPCLREEPEIAD